MQNKIPHAAKNSTPQNLPQKTSTFPLLPVRNAVIFPGFIMPLAVGRLMSRLAVKAAGEGDSNKVVIFCQKDSHIEEPKREELYEIGVEAKILKSVPTDDRTLTVIVQGERRVRLESIRLKTSPTNPDDSFYLANVSPVEIVEAESMEIEALAVNLRKQVRKIVKLSPRWSEEAALIVMNIESSSALADFVASYLGLSTEEKQKILETLDVQERLHLVTRGLAREMEVLELGAKIQSEVRGEFEKSQRQHYLQEQLRAIRKELGEGEGGEVSELKQRAEKANLSKDAHEAAFKELDRLALITPASSEYAVIRNYLEWLLEMPWKKATKDQLDIKRAKEILDADHYGLQEVKNRILEVLAVRKLRQDAQGSILCFVGPPGVGKTSLGRSIAEALGRKFVRISLGGVVDEAEIRGHRRTYVGALPGRIMNGIRRAGSNNPVFVLDEMDKLGISYQGDPASAMLEVLDPAQNNSFMDHFLDVPFDLSKVFFIGTANVMEAIPTPLLDRMEIIRIAGYTEQEKLEIAKRYLLPRQLQEHGLDASRIIFSDEALQLLIDRYTREAGVRELERKIAAVLRKAARQIVEKKQTVFEVTQENLRNYLGTEKYIRETAERCQIPGVATGLAWTPVGGEILFFEANITPGNGGLMLTGHLGTTMKESAFAALSYLRTIAGKFNIPQNKIPKSDVHLHVPAGAIPKDGPSAGIAILTALASAFSGRRVRKDIALTGEITLRGAVLPVGGIKEKALAAARADVQKVILPERNRGDEKEIPTEILQRLKLIYVSTGAEVLQHALEGAEQQAAVKKLRKRKKPRKKPRRKKLFSR